MRSAKWIAILPDHRRPLRLRSLHQYDEWNRVDTKKMPEGPDVGEDPPARGAGFPFHFAIDVVEQFFERRGG